MSTTTKNLIFVTGNVVGEYKAIAQELALNLYKSVYLDSPCSAAYHYKTTKDLAAERSYFFSQVLFYGSLPSRKNIVVSIPDLTMKNILQFLILFENVKKNVFVVVDDRTFITTFGKEKYMDLVKRLPMGCAYFFTDFCRKKTVFADSIDRLIERIVFNSNTATEKVLKDFNNIMSAIPPLFREEIRKSVFGSDFADVPFNMLVKNLLPEFNDCEKEEGEEEEKEKPPKKTIPDYYPTIKVEDLKEEEEEDKDMPALSPIEFKDPEEDDYISLVNVFPESDDAYFIPTTIDTSATIDNN